MSPTGKFDGERIGASLAVLGVHLAFWWILTHATTVFVPSGATEDALQVTWIDPSPAPVVASAPAPSSIVRSPHVKVPLAAPSASVQDASAAKVPISMSAVFIDQGKRWAEAQARGDGFGRDPPARRNPALPGRQADTFRMRDPVSPLAVLRSIGKAFAGADYSTDPCPRIHENIAGLTPGGDGERLQEELRRQHAYCH
jgi:hypothetical protein